jgi:hypothetical protein
MKSAKKSKKTNNGMLTRIKDQMAKSKQGIGAFLFVPADKKAKIRFISDFEEAVAITEHDKWGEVTPTPCLARHFDKHCPFCEMDGVRKREVYCWTVWDYNNKEKKIAKWAANSFTPTPQFISLFESYGTLLDRDYVVNKAGQGTSITYGVVPLDKAEFPKKLRPFTEQEILEKCVEGSDEIDMDEIEELDEAGEIEDDDETEEEAEEATDDEEEFELDEDEPFDE